MLTAVQLERMRRCCGVAVDLSPDVAEYLEGRADLLWSVADRAQPANDEDNAQPANDGALPLARPRWSIDRLAAALELRVVDERLPGLIVGAYVRAQSLVLVSDRLRAAERSPVVTHECGHAALHPRAPHEEVAYLGLALLYPRCLIDRLPPSRAITAYALQQIVAHRTPQWAAECRAELLSRVVAR